MKDFENMFKIIFQIRVTRYRMPLEDYREHFEEWLKDLKKTGGYWPIVERHNYNWSNIYFDLNQLFKDEVWNQVLEQRARERGYTGPI